MTTISEQAFSSCDGLTSVTIPEGVTTIDYMAFNSCYGLTSVTIPASVTSVVEAAFIDCPLLTQFNINVNNPNYSSKDGVLFNKLQTTLILYPAGKWGAFYAVPYGVLSIEDYAFFGCNGLTSVVIPNSVTRIGTESFYNCKWLESVTIQNNETEHFGSYGNPAFFLCDNLTVYCYANSNFIDYNEHWNWLPYSIITDFVDEGTGVVVQSAENSIQEDEEVIAVTQILETDTETYPAMVTAIDSAIQNNGSTAPVIAAAYEISLTSDEAEVQPDGNITISLPIPEGQAGGKVMVLHIPDEGAVEILPSTVVNGYAVFETDSLSDFVLLTGNNVPVDFITTSAIGKTGDTVTVNVNIAANSASGTGTIVLPYDPTKLEVVSAVAGPALTDIYSEVNTTPTETILSYIYDNPAGFNVGGTILSVTYKILAGAGHDAQISVAPAITELCDNTTPVEKNLGYTITYGKIVVDNTAPAVDGVEDGGHYNVSTQITFSDLNGATATLGGSAFRSGTEVSNEGDYTLIVTDAVGNVKTVDFEIDKTAPADADFDPSTANPTSSLTVGINYAVDAVVKQYSFDNSTWVTYNSAVPISVASSLTVPLINRTVYARSMDEAGNWSTPISQTFDNVVMVGDVFYDDKVSVVDALMTLSAATGKSPLASGTNARFAADVNGSTTVTALDALKILQFTSARLTAF